MRVGEPALGHGVSEPDALHAVRNAMRRIVMDDDLTMLIGPAADGRLLEIGVLDLDGEDRHSRDVPATEVSAISRMK